MAKEDDDTTRWSHSSGELRELQQHVEKAAGKAADEASRYSGIEGEASVAVTGNKAELRLVISSGEKARERSKLAEKRRREEAAREEAAQEEAAQEEAAQEEAAQEKERKDLGLVLSSGTRTKRDRAQRLANKSRDREEDAEINVEDID